jgi:hypothetical protein
MSYDVTLGKTKPVKVSRHCNGGTYPLGGTTKARLNITYNYGEHYRRWINKTWSLHWLHHKTAKDTIKQLEFAVHNLGTNRSYRYWDDTPGNAGYALSILLSWAKEHPRAKWVVI